MAPTTGAPRQRRAISVVHSGRPATKARVPVDGVEHPRRTPRLADPRRAPPPMQPWSGKRAATAWRMAASAPLSAAVTGSKPRPAPALSADLEVGAEQGQDGGRGGAGEVDGRRPRMSSTGRRGGGRSWARLTLNAGATPSVGSRRGARSLEEGLGTRLPDRASPCLARPRRAPSPRGVDTQGRRTYPAASLAPPACRLASAFHRNRPRCSPTRRLRRSRRTSRRRGS